MGDLYVSWSDYHKTIERLAAKVYQSKWDFDQIVCVARGGLRVGDTLSRIFKLPLAIIFTQSYTGDAGMTRGEITISRHVTMTTETLGGTVLLVDDLVDSGVTLDIVRRNLQDRFPHLKEMRSAVLWYKACSRVTPDYYAEYLAENPWIHQPFEPYDLMKPADLATRLG